MLDIGEVSSQSGLTPATLRFYEEKGLIQSAGRKGLRRLFDTQIIEQLQFIALARAAEFTLDEIKAMFSKNGKYQVDRNQLKQKADKLDNKIKQLQAVSKGLKHASVCGAPSHSECPKFQRLLRVALKTQIKQRK